MSLSTHIQTVRKLKPFLDAAASLVEMADRLQGLDQQVIDGEARVVRARQDADSAKADADSARAFAIEHIAKAKAEAEAITQTAKANAVKAEADATETLIAGRNAADSIVRQAEAKAAKLEAEAASLSESVKAKVAELASLDTRIARARETIRKQLEV